MQRKDQVLLFSHLMSFLSKMDTRFTERSVSRAGRWNRLQSVEPNMDAFLLFPLLD